MRLRWFALSVVFFFSVIGVYSVCRGQGPAVDSIVGMARRICCGALMGAGFWAASHLLQRWMNQSAAQMIPINIAPPAPPAPPVPSFAVESAGDSGRYRVRGFDRETRFETIEFVYADSPSNAQMKVELKGVVVASVEAAG